MHATAPQILGACLHIGLALVVSAHIVLTKSDVRAAIGWTGLVWLAPFIGSALYVSFGVNRIRRRAGRIRGRQPDARSTPPPTPVPGDPPLRSLATLVGSLTKAPLVPGNAFDPLVNGDEGYPAMLEAIDRAQRTVAMATYIFDRGQVADRFVDALGRAVARGVEVRVLIDGVGARYSRPPIARQLRARGVPVAEFLKSLVPVSHPYVNLRNHRKLLVVDGAVGFCGGLNIRDGCMLALATPEPTQDIHFRIRGPVVAQLLGALAFDWTFTTGEQLGPGWFPRLEPVGEVYARGIRDGPDEDFETFLMTLLGALSQATRTIRIVTPYFLPDSPLVDALRVATLRGVRVEILLPERGNLRLVQWAMMAKLARVASGCQIYLSRPPFDHSKLLVVDGAWSLIGSANWDPRSLRLNFEYVVEAYSAPLAARLNAIIDQKLASARPLSLDEIERRNLATKLRDGVAWLAQPYL
ncbi:MAG TPA: phospholipase D-like domain-containing protein [Gemmatimonadales bacterium]|nr:phospholipase D-like domain-containing protein [Gemmatimonadales bacterium]